MALKSEYNEVSFLSHDPSFAGLLGDEPSVMLLADTTSSSSLALYHEACVYHQSSRSVFVTSQPIPTPPEKPCAATLDRQIRLLRIHDKSGLGHSSSTPPAEQDIQIEDVTPSQLERSMLNGGVNFDQDSILLCAQGSRDPQDLSGLVRFNFVTLAVEPILQSFHGRPFNSVNDVVVHPTDSTIWFTDPHYGFHQGFRPPPQLPNQVYRYDPRSRSVRAVADNFTRPNGICFSPDLKILYVTDTGAIHGSPDIPIDPAGPSHVYAFDIVDRGDDSNAAPFLANRRLFAYAPGRFPDGIKCDTRGNVYSGCGDGIEVWNPDGVLMGTIQIEGGVANFCFGEQGVLYACNETKFWKIKLNGEGIRGALLGL